jgi:enamine deaminase RidA (YjgF/YER057c/UK114 family)
LIIIERKQISTGTDWEERIGYCRALKVGNEVHVSGTTATDDEGNIIGVDDPYQQTKQCIDNIETALNQLDAELEHVIRTRLFVVDVDDFDEIGRAHGEAFGEVRPTTTLVEISGLVNDDMLLEMEAEARLM